MHSRKLNWTQLNSTELDRSVKFSWVQFSFPLWIEPATSCDARRRFLTVKNRQRPSPVVASSQVVAVSMHSGKLNWTERSSSVEFSWVEFSSVQFPAVYWALESEKMLKTDGKSCDGWVMHDVIDMSDDWRHRWQRHGDVMTDRLVTRAILQQFLHTQTHTPIHTHIHTDRQTSVHTRFTIIAYSFVALSCAGARFSYSQHVRLCLSVRPSVCHTLVLTQN